VSKQGESNFNDLPMTPFNGTSLLMGIGTGYTMVDALIV
jgi:hypothetical protein